MKLKNKIFFYSTFLFAILVILLSATIYFTFINITYDRELNRVESNAQNILSGLRNETDEFSVIDLMSFYVPNDGMLRIVNQDGQLMSPAVLSGEVPNTLKDYQISFERGRQSGVITHSDVSYGFVQLPTIWRDGQVVYMQVFESLETVDNNLDILKLVLFLVTIIALIPVFVSGKLLSDLIIRPIQSLIQTMNEIKSSQTFKHIPLNKQSNDELYTMGQTFNELMDLLKENYEKQEAFVSNASHELRTPLTVIESYASLVKRRGLERPEVVQESIDAIHLEAVRMKDLTEQLLLLARRDQDWKLDITEIQLNQLIEGVAKNMERVYRRSIHMDAEESIIIQSDKQKLKQLIYILIDNACKYSDEPVRIELSHGSKPIIKIEDQGIGIPEDSLEKVFDRFYRVDEARNRDHGGTGLGLALAKELADSLNIDIELDSRVGEGTTVILSLNSLSSH
ncbi:sensor histidine kinase [Piscibacillus halophilus]|uniref:sensor histidine kinase n=1 Tax=Piscibacillus halophilus TaxID=571933 RepID=UPI00240A1875|nr:ATP-binding protein [Piscibacillus halophilus]